METNGGQRRPTEANGGQRRSMEVIGGQWRSMEVNGDQWKPTNEGHRQGNTDRRLEAGRTTTVFAIQRLRLLPPQTLLFPAIYTF